MGPKAEMTVDGDSGPLDAARRFDGAREQNALLFSRFHDASIPEPGRLEARDGLVSLHLPLFFATICCVLRETGVARKPMRSGVRKFEGE